MSDSRPSSLQEWADHIASLNRPELASKAVAANTMSFIQDLKHEGYRMNEIELIFALLARTLHENHLMLPAKGVYDYQELLAKNVSIRGVASRATRGPDDIDVLLDSLD